MIVCLYLFYEPKRSLLHIELSLRRTILHSVILIIKIQSVIIGFDHPLFRRL